MFESLHCKFTQLRKSIKKVEVVGQEKEKTFLNLFIKIRFFSAPRIFFSDLPDFCTFIKLVWAHRLDNSNELHKLR